MSKLFLIMISLLNIYQGYAQTDEISPLQGRLLLSFNGMVAVPVTDYNNPTPTPVGTGVIEYYFGIQSKNTLGFHLFGGAGVLEGTDDRRSIVDYNTNIYFFGGRLTYAYAFSEEVVPYISYGISNMWYNPKDINDNTILKDKPSSEDVSKPAHNYELGCKIFLSRTSTLNISGGEYIFLADNLDGLTAGNHRDLIFYGLIGISFLFF